MNKAVEEDFEWNQGTVTLTDGSTLTGLIKLNTKTGLLGYESGSTSKSYTARNVIGFSFFDDVENQTRNFISVTYKSTVPKKNGTFAAMKKNREKTISETGTPQFYEILVECKNFALLSTIGQMRVQTNAGSPIGIATTSGVAVGTTGSSTKYEQTESLLIFDVDGNVIPVLDITNSETDHAIFDSKKTKTKKRDKSVIEEYTETHFEQLEEYAKERKLSFKKKDDLITILEYYKTISSD